MSRNWQPDGIAKPSNTADLAQEWQADRDRIGDRSEIFRLLDDECGVQHALYVGSYVDLVPSYAIEQVTYVGKDRRAIRFFTNLDAVSAIVKANTSFTPIESLPLPMFFIGSKLWKLIESRGGGCPLLFFSRWSLAHLRSIDRISQISTR